MALQIWLPLNKSGDLSNKGLANVTVTNNGATYNASGKIGGCYKVNGNQLSIPSASYMEMKSGKQFSFACWAKGASSGWFIACSGWEIQFLTGHINVYPGGSSNNRDSKFNGTTAADLWRHIAFTWDGSNLILYVDGNALNTSTFDVSYNISSNINFCYQGERYLNDVRIYDHCLSAQEVKEISKGLVLHYPLNDTLVLTNAFNYPTFNTSAASGGWSHWGPSGATASWSLNTNKDYIFNKNNTYSHKFLHTGGSYYIVYQSPAFEGGYRSALAIIKMEGGEYPHNIAFSQNATVGTNPPTTFTALGDGFYLMKHEGFRQDGSDDLVSIWINNNVTVYISEVYLENDRQVCSNLFKTTNVVYDSSGYNNNGTIIGTLTTSTDTSRYDKCTNFTYGYITPSFNPIPNPSEFMTISSWVKLNSYGNGSYHVYIGGIYLCITNDGKLSGYCYGKTPPGYHTGSGTIPLNLWTHLAIVWDNLYIYGYINGILDFKIASTGGTTWTGNFAVGCYWGNTNYIKGNMSDFRIYATALSADDVKELYNTAAFIDHKGNVGCYLFYENSENLLKYENTLLYTNPANIDTRGKYVIRNNELAMAFKATDTYFGSSADKSKLLYNMFKPNTLYIFDLWIDTDDVIYNNQNVGDGFGIIYTDGTYEENPLYRAGSNPGETPKGFLHIVYVSASSKTIRSLSIYYYTSVTFYIRADSFITELSNTNIYKNGIIESGLFVEDTTIPYIGRANFNSNSLIEI